MSDLKLTDKYTYSQIMSAYLDCRCNKRNSTAGVSFEIDYEMNLWKMLNQVNNGTDGYLEAIDALLGELR